SQFYTKIDFLENFATEPVVLMVFPRGHYLMIDPELRNVLMFSSIVPSLASQTTFRLYPYHVTI
ncbi:hypothetical protein NE301_07610, partial [Lactococcus lactis]|uniref:hypothetical protein n=1 Tax=Lactococcus lactis TaxID=1358 RepID=UPI002074330A